MVKASKTTKAPGAARGPKTKLSRKALAAFVLQRPSAGASTKTLCADLKRLRSYLGKPVPFFGKRGVLQLAAPVGKTGEGAEEEGSSGAAAAAAPPRFNKYAGWAEWQNAIFLWVNASGGSFANAFTRGGRQVNWFVGGAHPTERSPIVQRLLSASRREKAERRTRVLLFVRRRATEPYINCGACGYVAHNAKKKGFEFSWELRDFGALCASPSFQALLNADKSTAPAGRAAAMRWA